MVTVHRQDGFRLVIYLEDHEPPHVHVYASGAEAKIGLVAQDGRPYVIRAFAMRTSDLRKAVQLVSEQQAMLVAKWREIHG
jgi:hypothetical protein